MKRILLLFSVQSQQRKLSDPDRLIELLNNTGEATFEYAYFNDITFYMSPSDTYCVNEQTGRNLEEYDAVYIRHWGIPESQGHGLAIARYCKLKSVPFIDREVWRVGSLNKLTQYINLFEAGVPFPRTFIAEGKHVRRGVERHKFEYPFILKAATASRGENNFLVEAASELEQILDQQPTTPFVVQQYIVNQGDYRVLVLDKKVGMIIHRQAQQGSHLNNTSKGGGASIVEAESLPKAMLDDCVKAASFFGRDFAGVDMVLDETGNHYCFEVNRAPQVEHSTFEEEKARKLSAYLVELAGDE